MARQPFVPIFFGDFLAATPEWDYETRGLYLQLLCYQWTAGSLPSELPELARMVNCHLRVFHRLWQKVGTKFDVVDGRLVNLRLEAHRERVEQITQVNVERGKKGAQARWSKHAAERGKAAKHLPNISETSSKHLRKFSEVTSGHEPQENTNAALESTTSAIRSDAQMMLQASDEPCLEQWLQSNPIKSKSSDLLQPSPQDSNVIARLASLELVPDEPLIDIVFERWRGTFGHAAAKLDPKRRQIITRALKSYTVEQLTACFVGYSKSSHHMGQNDRATRYDALGLLLRDADHIDAGIAFNREQPLQLTKQDLVRQNLHARIQALGGTGHDD